MVNKPDPEEECFVYMYLHDGTSGTWKDVKNLVPFEVGEELILVNQ